MKHEVPVWSGSKAIAWTNWHTDRQADRQTDTTENITFLPKYDWEKPYCNQHENLHHRAQNEHFITIAAYSGLLL